MRPPEVTSLLCQWSDGDAAALDRLMPLILQDLRGQAAAYLSNERRGHTLQPTALVNEVYLKLVDQQRVRWIDRAHFFAVAARLMRRILVDHARSHGADKRGGWAQKVQLDEARDAAGDHGKSVDLVMLDRALETLATMDERQARVVELRYFAGLTVPEVAGVLGTGHATVSRDWRNAKAWLSRELGVRPSPRGRDS